MHKFIWTQTNEIIAIITDCDNNKSFEMILEWCNNAKAHKDLTQQSCIYKKELCVHNGWLFFVECTLGNIFGLYNLGLNWHGFKI